jgi:hypothetical protein
LPSVPPSQTEVAEDLRFVRQWWKTSPTITSQVKDAIYCTIFCDDDILRTQSCHAFALLFAIEGERWIESVIQIAEIVETALDHPIQAFRLLSVMD